MQPGLFCLCGDLLPSSCLGARFWRSFASRCRRQGAELPDQADMHSLQRGVNPEQGPMQVFRCGRSKSDIGRNHPVPDRCSRDEWCPVGRSRHQHDCPRTRRMLFVDLKSKPARITVHRSGERGGSNADEVVRPPPAASFRKLVSARGTDHACVSARRTKRSSRLQNPLQVRLPRMKKGTFKRCPTDRTVRVETLL